jgi:hypothetical protein
MTRARSITMAKPTVKSILAECEKACKAGLGKKRLSNTADKAWRKYYRSSIKKALHDGSDWLTDRKNVLVVAKKLGKTAAALTGGKIVLEWAAEAAREAVKKDPVCPTSGGSGKYCR